jgi:hypothetical protein
VANAIKPKKVKADIKDIVDTIRILESFIAQYDNIVLMILHDLRVGRHSIQH